MQSFNPWITQTCFCQRQKLFQQVCAQYEFFSLFTGLDCLLNLTHTRPYNHSRLSLRSYAVSEVCVLGMLLNRCALSLDIYTDISKNCHPLGVQYI